MDSGLRRNDSAGCSFMRGTSPRATRIPQGAFTGSMALADKLPRYRGAAYLHNNIGDLTVRTRGGRTVTTRERDAQRAVTRRALLGATLAAGGTMVLAAACSSQDEFSPLAGENPDTTSSTAQSREPTPVLFWQPGLDRRHVFGALIDEFNQTQDAVNVTRIGGEAGLAVAMAAGAGPDALMLAGRESKSWASAGKVNLDLSPFLSRDKVAADALEAMHPAFVAWYRFLGEPMGLPWTISVSHTQYNVAHVAAAGLTPPAALGDRWDWNALVEYAQKLTTRKQAEVTRFGFLSPFYDWQTYVHANGGAILDAERRRSMVASPEAIDAVQYCVDFVHAHRVSPSMAQADALRRKHDSSPFGAGAVSMRTSDDWRFKYLDGTLELDDDVTVVARSPYTGRTGNVVDSSGIVMSPTTKGPDAAWRWMAYIVSKPVQDRIVPLFGEAPARLDSAFEFFTDSAKAGPPPSRKLLTEAIEVAIPLPAHDLVSWSELLFVAMRPSLRRVWEGEVSVGQGMGQMHDDINALLRDAEAGQRNR